MTRVAARSITLLIGVDLSEVADLPFGTGFNSTRLSAFLFKASTKPLAGQWRIVRRLRVRAPQSPSSSIRGIPPSSLFAKQLSSKGVEPLGHGLSLGLFREIRHDI